MEINFIKGIKNNKKEKKDPVLMVDPCVFLCVKYKKKWFCLTKKDKFFLPLRDEKKKKEPIVHLSSTA